MLAPEQMQRALAGRRGIEPTFRAALTEIPERDRNAWLDRVFGLDVLPEDGPELPRGCVPYLPSSVNTLLRMIELAGVGADDVFVDVGSGVGRATALTHLLTGAGAIGIEIQPGLVARSRALASRLQAERVAVVQGDAATLTGYICIASVFFLYCPFSGARLDAVLDHIGSIAELRTVRVCAVDLPLPARAWLTRVAVADELVVYRSVR